MTLCFKQRRAKDVRAYGGLSRCCCEELEDISYVASLALLLETLKLALRTGMELTENVLEELFSEFAKTTQAFLRGNLGVSLAFSLS